MKIVKRIVGALGALLLLAVALVGLLHLFGARRMAAAPEVATSPVAIPSDPAAIARGEHLVRGVASCDGCHGADLGGKIFSEGTPIGTLPAPNLTMGAGGVAATFTDAQWERALRHGIGGDGRTLIAMPSQSYAPMSDADLGAIVAYIRQLPPVDHSPGTRALRFPGTIFLGVLGYGTMPVNLIDHATVGRNVPAEGATVAYGEYLSHLGSCRDCHGPNLAGGTNPQLPMGPNLTMGGEMQGWSQAQFITAMRTGQLPSGRTLSEAMPWEEFKRMTDEELTAHYLYLRSLPPLEANAAP